MDEAFAGGVCRCKHCGAIQTVPSRGKLGAAVTTKKKSGTGKTLYSKSRRDSGGIPSSGLDQLAQAVASSGLSSGRLRHGPGATLSKHPVTFVAILIVVLIGGGAWWMMRGSPQKAVGSNVTVALPVAGGASPQLPDSVVNAPAFCGVPLNERTIIYVLDRGSATSESFSYLKEVTLRSAESLGAERKFQIVFWNNGSDAAFPFSAPTFASAKNVEAARVALDEIYPNGQTDVGTALTKAAAASPDAIILATAKGAQLGDEFIQQVAQIRGERTVKIHTFDIGGTSPSVAMKAIAEKTGGQSQLLSEGQLKHFAKE